MKHMNHSFQNCKLFQNRVNHYREIAKRTQPKMNVYAICCWPEVASDVVSGGNVKTTKGYALLNFEAAWFSNFRENQIQSFA